MLEKGTKLSHYRLEEMIGKGGMGEVWRATDGRLGREVALKVLPEIVTRDANRLDRFAREAKLLASLNHPGIATIHDVDEHEGIRFLVMELVPGEDLGETLKRGALPLSDALDTGVQIARAVEAAHGQGVVHRDLKPANVKRGTDGQVKVLDFGLAKAMEPDPVSGERDVAMSPTVTSAGTVAGMILGTAAYMSPEQARGREIDKRTDIWSFGVVLYELLTGDNPFHGETVADSVGAIMHRDIDLDALPPQTPTAVRRLLRRCLTRERGQRLHDIADVRIELEEAIANPVVESATAGTTQQAAPASKSPWIALVVLVPLAAALAWWAGSREAPAEPGAVRQFELVAGDEVDEVKISPDGTRVAYVVGSDLFIRSLDTLESRKIAEEETPGGFPVFWSPDGQSIGYTTVAGEIKRIDLDGGGATTLINRPTPMQHIAWGDDGFIYFIEFQGGISRVPESGGAAEPVFERHDSMVDYHGMALLPDGKGVVTIPHLTDGGPTGIFVHAPGREALRIHESDAPIDLVAYSPTGHLLFERREDPSGLWALPFSIDTLEATGAPFLVVPDLSMASFSESGDMIYARTDLRGNDSEQRIVWVDRTGQTLDRLELPVFEGSGAVPSPDGTRLALVAKGIGRAPADKANLWVVELERGTATRLTEEPASGMPPIWSEDGSRIAFAEGTGLGQGRILAVRADGSGSPEPLSLAAATFFFDLSDDWKHLAIMTGAMEDASGFDIAVETVGEPSSLTPVAAGPGIDAGPAIHPDGTWLAYMSGQIPDFDIYVQRFPSGEGRWKVAAGAMPRWSHDGTRLYYVDQDMARSAAAKWMEVSFDGSGAAPGLGTPVRLFDLEDRNSGPPTPDAQGRFILLVSEEPADDEDKPVTTGMILTENWLSRFDTD